MDAWGAAAMLRRPGIQIHIAEDDPLRPKSCVFARVLDANDLLDHNVG
jgi:hypothetical protein